MKDLPEGFDVSRLHPVLADGWRLDPTDIEYRAVGFGSYHWAVTDPGGRYFVTIDDLDYKPWLGNSRETTFAGLTQAFDTARALQNQSRLDFVVGPLASVQGETARRIGDRHAIAVFPFVEGHAGHFGDDLSPTDRAEVVGILVELHQATPLSVAPRVDVPLPGRAVLEAALCDVDHLWDGGPFSEPARAWLADHATNLHRQLKEFDRLAESLVGKDLVITHGEPHPGNFMRSNGRLKLIDWDTVALAPPERDLWMLATPEGQELVSYADATGQKLDEAAVSLYRLAWNLNDVAAYLDLFRSPHQRTEDAEDAWGY